MSEIMLATTYDPDKVTFPAEVSVKLDGVAADFYKTPNGWIAQSRQGKPLPSVAHITRYLNYRFKHEPDNTHIVGELTVVGAEDFKTAGGIIRRQEEDRRIVLNVYDMYKIGFENENYEDRVRRINKMLARCNQGCFLTDGALTWTFIRRVPVSTIAANRTELEEHFKGIPKLMESSNMFEGFMIRCMRGPDSRYKIGKRSRGMMRYKPKPTVDLEVVAFEEATANKEITFLGEVFQKDQGLRAVGRIVALYKGQEIGVGPGCLTHEERRDLWDRYQNAGGGDMAGKGLIAEVEYMLDNSYDALRQPIFKRWRHDKTEVSEHA